MVDAMVKWPTSSEPNETGLNLANKISNSFLTDIENSPERAKRSNDTMTFSHADGGLVRLLLSSHTTGAPSGLLLSSTWAVRRVRCASTLRGDSHVSAALSQDLAHVVSGSHVPKNVADRVKLAPHQFFKEQPIKSADIYLFRWISHDWADKYSFEIIRNLIPALKTGSKVVIGELCLPDPGSFPCYTERQIR